MTNHFHLLLAPEDGVRISRVLQSLAVAHTWHYHRGRGTVGHVWQGRFKSSVVQDDAPYRSFERMADYQQWCATQLPSWLGYGRV